MTDLLICPKCHQPVAFDDYFCPNCGTKLKVAPPATTLSKQIEVYLISLLLPPLGLFPAVNYLRQSDQKSKKIGYIAIAITIFSIIVTTIYVLNLYKSFSAGLNSQLEQYQNLGL